MTQLFSTHIQDNSLWGLGWCLAVSAWSSVSSLPRSWSAWTQTTCRWPWSSPSWWSTQSTVASTQYSRLKEYENYIAFTTSRSIIYISFHRNIEHSFSKNIEWFTYLGIFHTFPENFLFCNILWYICCREVSCQISEDFPRLISEVRMTGWGLGESYQLWST